MIDLVTILCLICGGFGLLLLFVGMIYELINYSSKGKLEKSIAKFFK